MLKICIAVENTVGEIYECFASMFPEQQDFWKNMAAEEQGHARQFVVASSLKGSAALPPSMQLAQNCLDAARKTKRDVLENPRLSLEDAFQIAIGLEQTTVEDFLERMIQDESDSELKGFYGSLLIDGRHHAEFLRKRLAGIRHGGNQTKTGN